MCPRIPRSELLYEECYSHIISRSIRKFNILKNKDDFEKLKQLLLIEKLKGVFKIYHYCLMHTHFHLVIRIEKVKDFSNSIADIKREYASYFHQKYKLSGPIWQERFKSLLIENEQYMFACGKYIEENPVKAGLVKSVGDWKFSSGRHYLKQVSDKLIDRYENFDKVKLLKKQEDIETLNFEKGNIIGSKLFKFQFLNAKKRD